MVKSVMFVFAYDNVYIDELMHVMHIDIGQFQCTRCALKIVTYRLYELTIVIRSISNQTLSDIAIFGSNLRADTREDITFRNDCNLEFTISFLDTEEEWRTIALLLPPTKEALAACFSKEHDDIIAVYEYVEHPRSFSRKQMIITQ